jgi:hypothetical protein
VGVLKKNTPNKLALMGRSPGLKFSRELSKFENETAALPATLLLRQIPGAPQLARSSRDLGYHCAQPESIRLTINT